jgi:hypothetical protein
MGMSTVRDVMNGDELSAIPDRPGVGEAYQQRTASSAKLTAKRSLLPRMTG